MATNFTGELVEMKKNGANTYYPFPLRLIKADSYKVTPNQRMESSANRAATGKLVRVTVEHTASKIDLETPPITNSDVAYLNDIFTLCYTDSKQRKLNLRYYDPSSDSYKTGEFYIPDIDYEINRISGTVIYYNPVRFAFIEY